MRAAYSRGKASLLAVALVSATSLFIAGLAVDRNAEAATGAVGTVTFLEGTAERQPKGGAWVGLSKGASLLQGDRLKTGEGTKFEATLNDGSMLRLGAKSELSLENITVSKKDQGKKKVSARLWAGRVWASVTSLFGDDSKFEVSTGNAVAGVRGTRFNALVDATGAATVKVYDGKVLVSNKPIYQQAGATKAKRTQVAGPQEISKNQWEEMIASAMQMVQIASNGQMTQPQGFELAQSDEWETWNNDRDKVAGLHK